MFGRGGALGPIPRLEVNVIAGVLSWSSKSISLRIGRLPRRPSSRPPLEKVACMARWGEGTKHSDYSCLLFHSVPPGSFGGTAVTITSIRPCIYHKKP